jgi:hypothetical protein
LQAIFTEDDVGLLDKAFHPYSLTNARRGNDVKVVTGAIKPRLQPYPAVMLDDNHLAAKERGIISFRYLTFLGTIENSFGKVKMRFQILNNLYYRSIETFNFNFKLCLALHNIHQFKSENEDFNQEITQHCYFYEAVHVIQVNLL